MSAPDLHRLHWSLLYKKRTKNTLNEYFFVKVLILQIFEGAESGEFPRLDRRKKGYFDNL